MDTQRFSLYTRGLERLTGLVKMCSDRRSWAAQILGLEAAL